MGVVENSTQGASGSQTREPHSVAIRLGEFGRRSLEAAARGHDQPIETVIADACRYFAVEIQLGRLATRLPRLRDGAGDCEPRELELYLPSRIWRALEQEAERQGAELSRIVEHASFLHLADLNSGRAVCRILESEEGD